MKALAWSPVAPPAAVFWTASGATLALNLKDAAEFFADELEGVFDNQNLSEINHRLSSQRIFVECHEYFIFAIYISAIAPEMSAFLTFNRASPI